MSNPLLCSAETEGSPDGTIVVQEFINKTMMSVDKVVPSGKKNGSAPLQVLSKAGFPVGSGFVTLLPLLKRFSRNDGGLR